MSDDDFDANKDEEKDIPEGFHEVGVGDDFEEDPLIPEEESVLITPGSSLEDEEEEDYNPLEDYDDNEWN
jgi:hypothetical protein